jgi:hypothetical protein
MQTRILVFKEMEREIGLKMLLPYNEEIVRGAADK